MREIVLARSEEDGPLMTQLTMLRLRQGLRESEVVTLCDDYVTARRYGHFSIRIHRKEGRHLRQVERICLVRGQWKGGVVFSADAGVDELRSAYVRFRDLSDGGGADLEFELLEQSWMEGVGDHAFAWRLLRVRLISVLRSILLGRKDGQQ